MKRAKWTLGLAAVLMLIQFVTAEVAKYMYDGEEYE